MKESSFEKYKPWMIGAGIIAVFGLGVVTYRKLT
jgi:hypothetical protein